MVRAATTYVSELPRELSGRVHPAARLAATIGMDLLNRVSPLYVVRFSFGGKQGRKKNQLGIAELKVSGKKFGVFDRRFGEIRPYVLAGNLDSDNARDVSVSFDEEAFRPVYSRSGGLGDYTDSIRDLGVEFSGSDVSVHLFRTQDKALIRIPYSRIEQVDFRNLVRNR